MGVLYRNEHEVANQCLVCNECRYVLGCNRVPKKILKHFPLILRLKQMFRTPNLSKFTRWQHDNISKDGYVKHVANSKAWAHINSTWPKFAQEFHNLRLGLALDGVNQFWNQSNTWSTWPILILNYNLPPWLTTKKFFLMLALLFLEKNQ
jgi:hypothetical protein